MHNIIFLLTAATIGTSWDMLVNQSEHTGAPISLSQFYEELRNNGQYYRPSKNIRAWSRYGKVWEATQAYHRQMLENVILTNEMGSVLDLTLRKLTGRDYEKIRVQRDFIHAVVLKDKSAAQQAVDVLLCLEPFEKRIQRDLKEALRTVREMELETRDAFDHRSSWSLGRFGAEPGINIKRVLTVGAVLAGGATILSGSNGILPRSAEYVRSMRGPVPQHAASQETINSSQEAAFDGNDVSGSDVERVGVSPLDFMFVADEGPEEDISAEELLQSFSDDVRLAIDGLALRLEQQIATADPDTIFDDIQSFVLEIGQMVEANPKVSLFVAEVLGVSALGYLAVKHPREFMYLITAFAIIGCTLGAGTGEIPTSTPFSPGEILPAGSELTNKIVMDEIEQHWSDFWVRYPENGEIKVTHLTPNADFTPTFVKGTEIVPTMEYIDENGERWVYTIAGRELISDEGRMAPSIFLVRYNPSTGELESFYLAPEQEGAPGVFLADQLNEDGFAVPAEFAFVRTETEDGIFYSIEL